MISTGVIDYYNSAQGYGFIKPDDISDAGDLIYFPKSEIKLVDSLKKDQRVTFIIKNGLPSRVYASNVIPDSGSETSEEKQSIRKALDEVYERVFESKDWSELLIEISGKFGISVEKILLEFHSEFGCSIADCFSWKDLSPANQNTQENAWSRFLDLVDSARK